jgi:hypothetical protein
MGAATRSKKQDTRKPNLRPNRLAETISVVISFASKVMVTLAVPQGEKLSEKGNITFQGGIRKGWRLPGSPVEALSALAFEVNGVSLNRSASGVHPSDAGNTTVFHSAVIEIENSEGEPEPYRVQVYATHRTKQGDYNLKVSAFPHVVPKGISGPQVTGELTAGEGFVLDTDEG